MSDSNNGDFKKYPVGEIPDDSFFSKTVYLDNGFIVSAPEMPFTGELKKTLARWEFAEVFSSGIVTEGYAAYTAAEDEGLGLAGHSDSERIHRAEKFYENLQQYLEDLYTVVSISNELDYNSVAEKIKKACEVVRENRRYLLRVQRYDKDSPDANYLASHSVKSTIIAIIIGLYLKLPSHRLIELGVSALLHEIGMIKLPPQVYLSKRALRTQEIKAIFTHPLLGFNMLKSFDFPLSISLGALEHHERENGSGYPRKLTGDKISLYSKIIAVACSYEALSSQRPHKEAKDGYTGMLELLKNDGKQYDDTIVRALVFSLSIYPIGLYVLLSSGRKGQVIDVNPENPRFPIVQVFGELTPDGKNKVLETSQDGISILRPLNRDEINTG